VHAFARMLVHGTCFSSAKISCAHVRDSNHDMWVRHVSFGLASWGIVNLLPATFRCRDPTQSAGPARVMRAQMQHGHRVVNKRDVGTCVLGALYKQASHAPGKYGGLSTKMEMCCGARDSETCKVL
jgi:hypothetical protein